MCSCGEVGRIIISSSSRVWLVPCPSRRAFRRVRRARLPGRPAQAGEHERRRRGGRYRARGTMRSRVRSNCGERGSVCGGRGRLRAPDGELARSYGRGRVRGITERGALLHERRGGPLVPGARRVRGRRSIFPFPAPSFLLERERVESRERAGKQSALRLFMLATRPFALARNFRLSRTLRW